MKLQGVSQVFGAYNIARLFPANETLIKIKKAAIIAATIAVVGFTIAWAMKNNTNPIFTDDLSPSVENSCHHCIQTGTSISNNEYTLMNASSVLTNNQSKLSCSVELSETGLIKFLKKFKPNFGGMIIIPPVHPTKCTIDDKHFCYKNVCEMDIDFLMPSFLKYTQRV